MDSTTTEDMSETNDNSLFESIDKRMKILSKELNKTEKFITKYENKANVSEKEIKFLSKSFADFRIEMNGLNRLIETTETSNRNEFLFNQNHLLRIKSKLENTLKDMDQSLTTFGPQNSVNSSPIASGQQISTKFRPNIGIKCETIDSKPNHLSNKSNESKKLLNKPKTRSPKADNSLKPNSIRIKCNFNYCRKEFKSNSLLENHLRSDHRLHQLFVCDFDVCSKPFASRGGYERHLKTHSKVKEFECLDSICDKRFITIYEMKRHLRTHRMT